MALRKCIHFIAAISFILVTDVNTLFAQGLTGPDQATVGVKAVFQFNDDYIIAEPRWETDSATIQTYRSGASCFAEVTWQKPGNYILKFLDGDILLSSVPVEVLKGCAPPPAPNAGADFTGIVTCGKTSVELNGSAVPENFSGRWSIVSGAGGSFSDVTKSNAVFSGLTATDYVLRWSVGIEDCVSSDEVLIRFNAPPPTVPTLSGDARFGPGPFSLVASGAPSSSTYQWRNVDGEILSEGMILHTEWIPVQQPRYGTVRILDQNGCTGDARAVALYIEPDPVVEASSTILPEGGQVLLRVKGRYDLYIWKDMQDEMIGTGPELWITEPGTFVVDVTKSGITGIGRSLPVEVKAPFRVQARSKQIVENPQKPSLDSHNLETSDLRQVVRYLDGLGRPLQNVERAWTTAKEDRVEPFVYDSKGRSYRSFLPVIPGGSSGDFRDDLLDENDKYAAQHLNFFKDDFPYQETKFEDTPLDKPVEQMDPGMNWKIDGRSKKFTYSKYISGTGLGQEQVIAWEINDRSGLPVKKPDQTGFVKNGYYLSGTLEIRSEKDEQGFETRTYLDAFGRVVLKKIQAADPATNQWAQTYYIYDGTGKIRFVLQPELVQLLIQLNRDPSASELASLAFRYRYDPLGRVVALQEPGKDSVLMVYDHRDRVVLTQDGNQRSSAPYRWTFFKYDELNRMIATGIKDTVAILSQAAMQSVVNVFYQKNSRITPFEQFVGYSLPNIHGYTNRTYPVFTTGKTAEPDNYLRVLYYDQYSFSEGWSNPMVFIPDDISGTAPWTGYLSGVQTGKKVKVLDGGVTGGSTWLGTVVYHDEFLRPIQIHSENYKGGTDVTSLSYDFTGQPVRKRRTHQRQDLSWKDQRVISIQGNKLICGNTKVGWTSGAASVESLGSGRDGWLEFTATERGTMRAIGFSDQNTNTNYTSIDYAFYLNTNGSINIFEQAVGKFVTGNFGTYRSGDRFRIERKAGVIRYYRNEILLRTSVYPSSGVLLADVSMSSPGATLARIRTSFSSEIRTIEERFISDHQGRISEIWHKFDNGPEILVAKNTYDQQGRLSAKSLHASATSLQPKQRTDYRYHIRGWLESINPVESSTSEITTEFPDLFSQKLFYEKYDPVGLNSTPRFNGQISSVRTINPFPSSGTEESGFVMQYDGMNRFSNAAQQMFTSATGWKTSGNEEKVTAYDLNGNIRSLIRKEQNVIIDDLIYQYLPASNQLSNIQDRSGEKFRSFIDGVNSSSEYTYDRNGNLVTDLNKGLNQIINYNILDLPELVSRGGNRVQLVYSAEGEKLAETIIYSSSTGTLQKEWVGPLTFDQNQLQSVDHIEGRIMMQNTELIFTDEGTNRNLYSVSGASLSGVTLNGETYLAVTATSNTSRSGIQAMGGVIPVMSGERYRIKVRGYRVAGSAKASNPVFISFRLNGSDLEWPGATLPFSSAAEHEIEQVIDIPTDGMLQIGLTWNQVSFGEIVYLNKAEISRITGSSPEYQYYLKDHLENIRTVFTSEPETENRLATAESEVATREQKEFLRYDQVRMVNAALFDRTKGNQSGTSIRLNGSSNERFGLASSISVMPGDVIEAEVWAKFVDPTSENWTSILSGLMSLIVSGSSTVVKDGSAYTSSTSSFPFASLHNTGGSTGTGPKAYLNWLVFDKKFNLLPEQSGYVRMSNIAREYGQDVEHERLKSGAIRITKPGYVYIYFSNEENNPIDVYFDDFNVIHRESPVIQSTDYFPFGTAFNQQVRENTVPVNNKFNSMEEQTSLELAWLRPSRYRSYDPLMGRFMQTDPVVKDHESLYAWNTNDPVRFADPFGADSAQRARAIKEAERYVRNNPDPGGNGGYGFAGFHAGSPGKPIDCSGMVSQCADVSGFGTLNNYVKGKPNNNGVKNILDQPLTREVPLREITEGNIIVFPNDSHIAFVSNIVRDRQQNVTGFTLIHSEGTGGPNKDIIDLNNANNYYVRKYLGVGAGRARFYAWDTPDKPVTPQQRLIKK